MRILLADDEKIELRYLESVFSCEKAMDIFKVVDAVTDGRSAVESAKKYKPHIFITDIKMPVMDGIEAALKIREIDPKTIIILNTAYAEFEFAKKALENQFDAYILKPTMSEEILQTVKRCIEAKKDMPDCDESTKESKIIRAAKEYISSNINKRITLKTISEYVHFSPSYFSRMFKETEGIALSQYINLQRVKLAVKYIETTDLPIKDICSACGFSSISNFNREYKKYAGLTPSQMRREQS